MAKTRSFPSPADTRDAVILARVSSRDQEEGYSIDAQRNRLEQYCGERGMNVLATYEIVESSTIGDRRKFMEMIKFIKAQRRTIALVADKVDRVQRSFKEHSLLNEFISSGSLELHFRTENYVVARGTSSQGKFMWNIGVALAQNYTDSLSDNVRRAFKEKVRGGEWLSSAPLGYVNVRLSGRGSIAVDEERAPLVVKLFETFACGNHSISQIAEVVRAWRLRNRLGSAGDLSRSQVHKILRNPFYYGVMVIKGQRHPHNYPPLISKVLFDTCQRILDGRSHRKTLYRGNEFVFRGLLTCKTTARTVTADMKRRQHADGRRSSWTYLRCWKPGEPAKIMWVREELVLGQAERALALIAIPEPMVDHARGWLRSAKQSERGYHKHRHEELRRQGSLLKKRLDTLMDCLLDGTIRQEDFEAKRTSLRDQQIELAEQMKSAEDHDDGWDEALMGLMGAVRALQKTFASSKIAHKRAMLNLLFANLQLDGENLCFSYRKPFDLFVDMNDVHGGAASRTRCEQMLEQIRTDADMRKLIVSAWKGAMALNKELGEKPGLTRPPGKRRKRAKSDAESPGHVR